MGEINEWKGSFAQMYGEAVGDLRYLVEYVEELILDRVLKLDSAVLPALSSLSIQISHCSSGTNV